uniref:Uncharacterized protein n=1 Tax=Lotharella globosa TaxID=91324 RepID=A0A7S4DXI2_9EUKA|mmetsp:Transcript_22658/g.45549  ORF Transcript_22658/g.45549 Transcript_22658/m.45549 type:complete len:181 (+) Transcript_22658:164-706(+)
MWAKIGHNKQRRRNHGYKPLGAVPSDLPQAPPQQDDINYGMYRTTNRQMMFPRVAGAKERKVDVAAGKEIRGYTQHARKRGARTEAPLPSRKALINRRLTHEDGILQRPDSFNKKVIPPGRLRMKQQQRQREKLPLITSYQKFCKKSEHKKISQTHRLTKAGKFRGGFAVQCRTDTCPWE